MALAMDRNLRIKGHFLRSMNCTDMYKQTEVCREWNGVLHRALDFYFLAEELHVMHSNFGDLWAVAQALAASAWSCYVLLHLSVFSPF